MSQTPAWDAAARLPIKQTDIANLNNAKLDTDSFASVGNGLKAGREKSGSSLSSIKNSKDDKLAPATIHDNGESHRTDAPTEPRPQIDESEDVESAGPSPPPQTTNLPIFADSSQHGKDTSVSTEARVHDAPHSTSAQCPAYSSMPTVSQHVAFFDRSRTGIITPFDIFHGFRELGFGWFLSIVAVLFINGTFSLPSWGWRWDWRFRCRVEGMNMCKHGSDTGVYTVDGGMNDTKFEEMWNKWSKDGQTMEKWDLVAMVADHRVVFDPFGWTASIVEWGATYLLLWPADCRIRRDDVKKMYTGELFWEIAEERKKAEITGKHKNTLSASELSGWRKLLWSRRTSNKYFDDRICFALALVVVLVVVLVRF